MILLSSDVIKAADIDWYVWVIGTIVVIFAAKGVIGIIDWFIDRFGITFKWDKEKASTHEIIENHEEKLNSIIEANDLIVTKIEQLSTNINELGSKVDNMETHMSQIDKRIEHVQILGDANREANIMEFADILERKMSMYIEQNGIPENEYKTFVDMFELYDEKLHGNHGIQNKFKYCIDSLPIIPSTIFATTTKTDNIETKKE